MWMNEWIHYTERGERKGETDRYMWIDRDIVKMEGQRYRIDGGILT
jgi:hypothetical protein